MSMMLSLFMIDFRPLFCLAITYYASVSLIDGTYPLSVGSSVDENSQTFVIHSEASRRMKVIRKAWLLVQQKHAEAMSIVRVRLDCKVEVKLKLEC